MRGVSFDKAQQRRARDRDPAVDRSTPRALRRAGYRSSGWSTCSPRRRRASSACARKGAVEVGRDADLVLFDPAAHADDPRRRPPPHQRLHAVRRARGHGRGSLRVRPWPRGHPRRRVRRHAAGSASSSSVVAPGTAERGVDNLRGRGLLLALVAFAILVLVVQFTGLTDRPTGSTWTSRHSRGMPGRSSPLVPTSTADHGRSSSSRSGTGRPRRTSTCSPRSSPSPVRASSPHASFQRARGRSPSQRWGRWHTA